MYPVRDQLYEIISEVFEVPIEELSGDMLWKDYDIESFGLVELIIAIQEDMNVRFETRELAKIASLDELEKLIQDKIDNV